MMLGVLLARAGVKVLVLEKHQDFLRDFRGDTIHPSTLQVMNELGWLDELLQLPHQKVEKLSGQFGDTPLTIADFSHLPVKSKFIALMPQWDFLDFLADKGARLSGLRPQDESRGAWSRFRRRPDHRREGQDRRRPDDRQCRSRRRR